MVMAVILEGVAHLDKIVVPMMVDKLLVITNSDNVNNAGGITTSLRSAGRSLVALNGQLVDADLLPLMILPMFVLLQLLILVSLPLPL